MDNNEYSSKSELVNDLIRQARKQQAQIDWIRTKIEKAENTGFTKDALFYFGISFIKSNRNLEALRLFACLEIDYPNYFGGYYGSTVIYEKEKNIQKAIEHCNKTIKYCADNKSWASEHSRKMLKTLKQYN